MNEDFRQRVFLPVILPLGVVVGFIGFAFMLSRVLLAVEEMASTAIALGLAAYILAIAGIVSAKPRITSRALAVGVSLGLVAVVGAGVIATAAGMREIHHGEEPAAAGEPADDAGTEGEAATEPADGEEEAAGDELTWTAVDIDFAEAPESTTAGEKTVTLVNEGAAEHNVTIPDVGGDTPIVEAAGGETAEEVITLEPGTYEYFCSIPGHEQSMNGELTVE